MSARPMAVPTRGGRDGAGEEGPVNILLVDDGEENLLALEAVLKDLGHNLVLARSGEEALKQVLDHALAVILLDVRMPGLDGYETAALIRGRPASMHTPIIFVTAADSTPEQVFRGYSVGAVDYIAKPIQPEILRSKVAVFVDLHRKNERLQRQAEALLRLKSLEHEVALAAAERRRNRFFSLSVDMMGLFDADGCLREANPAWERTLGVPVREFEGRRVADRLHEDDQAGFQSFWQETLNEGTTRAFEGRFITRTGWRWLSWSARAYQDEQIVYAVVRDVTPQREAMLALDRHARELARSNADLEQFAFIASHDLREPLRVITSYAQLLARQYRGRLDGDADEYIGYVTSGVSRMQDMVDDLLAFAQVGKESAQEEDVPMEEALARARENLSRIMEESAALVECDPLPVVRGSRFALTMLFQNLLENAVKYRQEAPPRIRIRAEEGDGSWTISVADNGIGIQRQHFDKIFRIFQRLHGPGEHEGTGIGLAIAARVVAAGGGRIWVTSEPRVGSTFHFTWPKRPPPA
ncbi:MAG TPA: ATP-binding protein [Candidatus Polarisedimenticolaceae bacterium]|nr:ATP-binding protein [Candidatus Polarisedimenticolaceae bacterium]